MDENFTKFNSSIMTRIYDFINSQNDLLYITGFQGSGKSEIVNRAMDNINKDDILLFRHLCFENSAIDDFLLSFYDTLRYYSINKKINLKKSLTENFAQKVSFYFKNLNKKSIIIIDNFEIISKNSEIIDFLAALGKYESVKLILISRILNQDFFEKKGLHYEIIDIVPNDYSTFKLKIECALENYKESDIEELFKQTKGYELYLSMALRYIATVNTSLREFMEEFKKRRLDFDDFLLSKIVSLVPPIYLPFLQNMSCLNHSVTINFIEKYRFGDISLVNYLYRKLLISKFDDEIYLKDYLKQYFLNSLSLKEKINNYKNLIQIYENELCKSPKDRLLRLSRESIRKQIDFVKSKIPNVSPMQTLQNNNFSYISQTRSAPTPWYRKMAASAKKKFETPTSSETPMAAPIFTENSLSEEEKELIENFRKNKIKSQETEGAALAVEKPAKLDITLIFDKIKEFEENFDYKSAIQALTEFLSDTEDNNIKKDIYLKLAKNYTKINNFEEALKNYNFTEEICKKAGNNAGLIEIKVLKANLYKNLYRFEKAKNCLNEAIILDSETSKTNKIRAYIVLGEIFESENNFEKALENYKNALELSNDEQSDNILLAEIYFKIALLYDDGQNPKTALEFYEKSIIACQNVDITTDSEILSTSFTNTGLIYADIWSESGLESDFKKSLENFRSALEIDRKEENYNGIYFTSKQLAELLRDTNPLKASEYLNLTLDAAIKLDDSFKIALSYLEIGDYNYNIQDNKAALKNYCMAKKALGANISNENEERISVRINDMKIKMNNKDFMEILKEYE